MWKMPFCEFVKYARSDFVENIYMSTIDCTETCFMDELGLPADEDVALCMALSILHTLRGTSPRKGKPIGGEEEKKKAIKNGSLVVIDTENLRPMSELIEKLKE